MIAVYFTPSPYLTPLAYPVLLAVTLPFVQCCSKGAQSTLLPIAFCVHPSLVYSPLGDTESLVCSQSMIPSKTTYLFSKSLFYFFFTIRKLGAVGSSLGGFTWGFACVSRNSIANKQTETHTGRKVVGFQKSKLGDRHLEAVNSAWNAEKLRKTRPFCCALLGGLHDASGLEFTSAIFASNSCLCGEVTVVPLSIGAVCADCLVRHH